MLERLKQKFSVFYTRQESRLEIGFFVGGFLIDVLFISEIDDLFSIAQQALYILSIAAVIHHEILFRMLKWRPVGFAEKIWGYRNLILHFLLGSLLSLYSLFYIKSSSLFSSLIFLAAMIVLLVANELPAIKNAKVSFKVGLFAICLFSFMSILFPLILGFVGWIPFLLSVASTLGILYWQFRMLKRNLEDERTLLKVLLFPGVSVLAVFTLFYFMGWIPPVPISVKQQGVYHLVEKKDGKYLLSTDNPWWKFWNSGDQNFMARDGDKIYFYAQIYSPARFSDQIFIRWQWKDPKVGWQKTDRIPMPIVGGRKEGFRGFATKANYQPGDWRVIVETSMGHEISRLSFEVNTNTDLVDRAFTVLER